VKKPIKIIYIDDFFLIIDKPAGILTIPDRYDLEALVALSMLEPTYGSLFVVHRIDKDTSGVLMYARNEETHKALSLMFSTREVEKSYLALVRGNADRDSWDCSDALLADADRLHRTLVDSRRGKASYTAFDVVERLGDFTLVRAKPETGRTHQIRVHCTSTGYPIVGDPLYGDGEALKLSTLKRKWKGDLFDEKPLISRTALHAEKIKFAHPKDGRIVEFEAPLPRDLSATIAQLRRFS
jgi:RluA family pseudouridine synthase